MRKALLLLVTGAALGYWWGFSDARINKDDVVTRLVERVGGKTRGNLRNDTDRMMDSLERR